MSSRFLVAVVVLASCSSSRPSSDDDDGDRPDAPGDDAGDDADAARPPATDPSQPGPWLAGVTTVTVTDPARGRSFDVEVWYPVDPAIGDGSGNTYSLLGGLIALDSPARRDATPAPGGPWPLVVFSHGYGGIRFQSFFLTEHLATRGFVVIAPD